MLIALDFPSTIHPVDNNLVVSQKPPNDDVYLMAMKHSRDRCHHVVLLETSHREITRTRRLRWFQLQHDVPRMLKTLRSVRATQSTCLQAFSFRYPGITQETREMTLPVIRSAWKRDISTACCYDCLLWTVLMYSSLHISSQRHVHRFFPVSATFRSPCAKQQYATHPIANVCTRG